jgi:hypothetical protein
MPFSRMQQPEGVDCNERASKNRMENLDFFLEVGRSCDVMRGHDHRQPPGELKLLEQQRLLLTSVTVALTSVPRGTGI